MNLYWDTNFSGDGGGIFNPGDGAWDPLVVSAESYWNINANAGNGGSRLWTVEGNPNNAFFPVNGGTSILTVANNPQVNSITFNGTGYTVQGSILTLTGAGGNITVNAAGTIDAPIGGSVGLTKSGGATLTLGGANTYTGNTAINTGTLLLSSGGSIANSNLITVASGATFDVSAVTGYTVGVTQTLAGGGTVTGATAVAGTLAPTSPGTLTFANDLTFNSASIFSWDIAADGGAYGKVVGNQVSGSGAIFNIALTDFTDTPPRLIESGRISFQASLRDPISPLSSVAGCFQVQTLLWEAFPSTVATSSGPRFQNPLPPSPECCLLLV